MSASEPSIAVVLPAYNESRTIGALVSKLRERCLHVIVVDDGSEDQTSKFAHSAGAHVIKLDRNRGLGQASRIGLAEAIRLGYQIVATMDADGQHLPEELEPLVKSVAQGYDAAFAFRARNLHLMPFWRRLLNAGTRIIMRIITGRTLRDPLCGFRAFSSRCLRRLELRGDGHELVPGVAINAILLGMRVREVPITCVYDSKPVHYRLSDFFRAFRLYAYFLAHRILHR
jgi:glycosyltransferase involved in cell wall biosynthesis